MAVIQEAPRTVIKIAPEERSRLSNQAVMLTLGANILLALLKTIVGIVGHSTALLADGVNSTSDVVYNIVVTIFVRRAHKPADSEHPYGHTQLESVGALIVGAFIITTALTIFWNSVSSLFDLLSGEAVVESASILALVVALFTVALKLVLSIYSRGIGEKTQNPAIIALAQDHRNDIFSAAAVVIGIILSRMGYHWVDPAAGAIVAFVILRTGLSILTESTDDLMDTVPGDRLLRKVTEILEQIPSAHGIDTMQAHRFGQYLVINITIFVDGNLTIDEGDRISDQIEAQLADEIDYVRAVHVHFHARHASI
jgi:cation diffusion facilitator family transporter